MGSIRVIRLAVVLLVAGISWTVPDLADASTAPPPIKARTFHGEGDDVVRVPSTKLRGIAVIRHSGESNFAVWSIQPSGKDNDLLVNRIGDYSGTVVVNTYTDLKTAGFTIEADGAWSLRFAPISYAPLWKHLTEKGLGDAVLKLAAPTKGLHTLRYAHGGTSTFVVYALPPSGAPGLLVNKIGHVSGKVVVPAGTRYVSVLADGKWTLTRK
ncbi:hypothetical protein GCM10009530_11840 [Microbispora corallina]|uniref:Uncharacterized protein n=1 Tax=Microbispora corallina TaxID=83302 RepID=A0ABQ4FTG7_9ACTN|nr:hypothetical protein [Microbispora corallina]GIH38119.1 hypothetical protein Mco01_11190 [Microbispora corallina]